MSYFLCRSCGRRLFEADRVCKNCGGEVYERALNNNLLDTQGNPIVIDAEPEEAENFMIKNSPSAEKVAGKTAKRFIIFCERCGRNLSKPDQFCTICGGRAYVQPLTNMLDLEGNPLAENIPQEIIEQQLQKVPSLNVDDSWADEKTYNFIPYIIIAVLMLLSCTPATVIGIFSIIIALNGSKKDEKTYKILFYLNIAGIIVFLLSFAISLATYMQTQPRLS